jgi:hypothetical protein
LIAFFTWQVVSSSSPWTVYQTVPKPAALAKAESAGVKLKRGCGRMRFAKWVFLLAGLSGVLMILPLYMEDHFFQDYPPRINRPEFYYGFAGVTLAWQFMFLVISSDPVRYRVAMLAAMLEKAGFAVAVPILYAADRVTTIWLSFAAMDATWLLLFVVAFLRTPKENPKEGRKT